MLALKCGYTKNFLKMKNKEKGIENKVISMLDTMQEKGGGWISLSNCSYTQKCLFNIKPSQAE